MKNLAKLSLTMPKFARYLAVAVQRGILAQSGADQIAVFIDTHPHVVPFNTQGFKQDFPSLDFSLDWHEVMDILEKEPTALDLDALIDSVSGTAEANTIKQLDSVVEDASDCLSKARQKSNTIHKAPNVLNWLNHVFIANGHFAGDMLNGEETIMFVMIGECMPEYKENCDLDADPLEPDFFK